MTEGRAQAELAEQAARTRQAVQQLLGEALVDPRPVRQREAAQVLLAAMQGQALAHRRYRRGRGNAEAHSP